MSQFASEAAMPKEHIPATPKDAPQPIEDEDLIEEQVEEEKKVPLPEEEPVEEGGLGPRG
jgi:hypothetical protein